MKNLFAVALLASAATFTATAADARDGCGRNGYRGPAGHCRYYGDRGRVVVAPGRLVIGNFYRGQGYWDGHRYWQNRYRHRNGGWRYR